LPNNLLVTLTYGNTEGDGFSVFLSAENLHIICISEISRVPTLQGRDGMNSSGGRW